ncbi:MAG: hypothetical protein JW996_05625, partial [Candidatus Cloacimonetes bacterium]|nr:hypothetical protein [Candidatus Cloacimonadota bacterium]
SMNWSGIPLHPENKVVSEGLDMKISWVDESGNPIDPGNLSQGTVFYQRIRVNNLLDRSLENLAFNQILPSGWEIENDRFRNNDYQNNSGKEKNQPGKVNIDYTDIRDDRIYCFFDLAGRNQFAEIEIKLRAVTSGSFELPPAVCEAMYAKQYKAVSRGRKVQVY